MDTSDLKQHYSQQFNAELEEIRSRVLAMGGLVERQLEMAVASLSSGESEAAETVVSNDYKVNAYDVEIDEMCTNILALRQPTASDLRLVLAVIKTTADLERIGDEAKRVARMAIRAAAADHGVDAFIFDWYYYDDGPFLERGVEEGFMKAANADRLRFGLMWANHDWIDIHPATVGGIGEQARLLYPGAVTRETFDCICDTVIERYFSHPAYWQVDGCPYFSVYFMFILIFIL